MGKRRKSRGRQRVGKVSYFFHHGAWWIYYVDRRTAEKPVRRQVAKAESEAAIIAAQVNAQLAASAPTLFSFTAVPVAELQRQFIDYHEHVVRSSLATVRRYRTANRHLVNYSLHAGGESPAHEVNAEGFVRYRRCDWSGTRLLRITRTAHCTSGAGHGSLRARLSLVAELT
jgi:integrase